jgi:very-short-patch-repair endonuclease
MDPSTSPYPAFPVAGSAPAFESTGPRCRPAISRAAPTSRSPPRAAPSTISAARPRPTSVRSAARQAQNAGFRVTTDRTRSDLELDFGAFCRRHRLPTPEVNVRLGTGQTRRFTVDFLWRPRRLVVETDSYEYHQGDVAFEDDHSRDLALRRMSFEVLRYTGRQLEQEGVLIAAEIRARLGARLP